jgi:BlaI family transcriptional regulator, penicillinase repressor
MAKQKSITLTKFELEIMRVLWDLERASVREIQERLSNKRRPAYTTVQTIIHRLEEKSAVRRLRKIGNALIFEPVITRKAVHGRLITELLQLFGGSARPLMAHLAEMGKLNLEDVRELETLMTDQQENHSDSSILKRGKRDDKS